MNNFHCIIGVIFFLYFVPYECVGKVHLPPEGDRLTFAPGTTAKIKWSFDANISKVRFRAWYFLTNNDRKRSTKGFTFLGYTLAFLYKDSDPEIYSKLSGVAIEKPATLVLNNVNTSYNGSYGFWIVAPGEPRDPSYVSVFIAVMPTVTVNCSNPITVNEGGDVTCACKGEGGNPPADVKWYSKDGNQIGGTTKEEQTLTLSHVGKTDSGTYYTCVAQSHELARNETSIEIIVNYAPEVSFFEERAVVGESFTIKCEANGRPEPNYTIVHNNTEVIGTDKTYTIAVVSYSHAGLYKCIAENILGKSSKIYLLSVVDQLIIPTIGATNRNFPTTNNSGIAGNKADDEMTVIVWHIVISSVAGFIMGILTSCIVMCCCRLFSRRKPQTNSQPQAPRNSSIYQELDLNKMNSEDNYQVLRQNVTNSEPGNESVYMDLNQTARDDDNQYQSLT